MDTRKTHGRNISIKRERTKMKVVDTRFQAEPSFPSFSDDTRVRDSILLLLPTDCKILNFKDNNLRLHHRIMN